MINELSKSMVRRLTQKMTGWEVDDFPNAPDRYPWAHKTATLLVVFEGTTYGDVESMSPPSATRDIDMSVTVLARNLRGDLSIASALEDARLALFGWRPTNIDGTLLGFRALRPVSERFVSEEQGVWRFVAMYRSATVCVADIMALTGAPLTQANFKEAT